MSIYYTIGKVYEDGETLFASNLNTDKQNIDTAFTNLEASIIDPSQTVFNNQFRNNSIINGRFQIWNEGTTKTNPSNGDALAEMWYMDRSYSAGVVDAFKHTPTATTVWDHGIRMEATTPAASGANDYLAATYRMEGNDLNDFRDLTGTLVFSCITNPSPSTVSVVFTNGVDRWYVTELTTTGTSIWDHFFVAFPFSTAGGTWNYDENTGLYIHFTMGAGSGVKSATPQTWETSAVWAGPNQTDLVAQTNGRLTIANVWMFPSVATANPNYGPPADQRTPTETQALTQRYYEKSWPMDSGMVFSPIGDIGSVRSLDARGDGTMRHSESFSVEKRAPGTVTTYGDLIGAANTVRAGSVEVGSTIVSQNKKMFYVEATVGISQTAGFYWDCNARLT